jgi:hypothetical protein
MAQRTALITFPLGLRRPLNRSEVWPCREWVRRWVNACLFSRFQGREQNRVLLRPALGFRALGDEFHQLIKMDPKCAAREVLAGFKRRRDGFTTDG